METINAVFKGTIAVLGWVFALFFFGIVGKIMYLIFMLGWEIV